MMFCILVKIDLIYIFNWTRLMRNFKSKISLWPLVEILFLQKRSLFMLTLPVGLFELLIHQYRNGKYLIFMGNCCKQETPLHLIYHLVKMVCFYYNWRMFIKNTHNHCKKKHPEGCFFNFKSNRLFCCIRFSG